MKSLALTATVLISLSHGAFAQGERDGWPDEIRFALNPTEADNVDAQFGRLFAHIESELGVPVRAFRATDATAIVVALANDQVEATRIGANAYVLATENAEAVAVAMEELPDRGTGYHGGLWVRSDSGLETIADTEGLTIAFGDPTSTSSYLVPMVHFMQDLDIDPEAFYSRVIFAGDAVPTIQALQNSRVDVAAFSNTMHEVAVQRGIIRPDELAAVWQSDLIPNPPYVVRADLPESFRAAFQQALVGFDDPEGLAGLPGGPLRIVPASDGDYDSVRRLDDVRERLQQGTN